MFYAIDVLVPFKHLFPLFDGKTFLLARGRISLPSALAAQYMEPGSVCRDAQILGLPNSVKNSPSS